MKERPQGRVSIYIPQSKQDRRPIERLGELAKTRGLSVSHLIVEAVLEYLERMDGKAK